MEPGESTLTFSISPKKITHLRVHSLSLGLSQGYLIEIFAGLILVDAGMPGFEGRILRLMRSLKREDLRLIYITHAHLDHYGSAAKLRERTGAPIAVHRADAESLALGKSPLGSVRGRGRLVKWLFPLVQALVTLPPTAPDILLEDGQTLEFSDQELTVLHTPGHTPGSSCLLVNGEIAFAGDLVSTTGEPHLQRYFAFDWVELSKSLACLQKRKPRLVYPGHGRIPMSGSVLEKLKPDNRI